MKVWSELWTFFHSYTTTTVSQSNANVLSFAEVISESVWLFQRSTVFQPYGFLVNLCLCQHLCLIQFVCSLFPWIHFQFLKSLSKVPSLPCFLALCLFLGPFLSVYQSLPLVVSLLSGTGWGAPRGHVASRPPVTLVFTLLMSWVVSWGQLAGVGAGGSRRPPCAPTTSLCRLVDLLRSILTGLWVLWAWKQLFFSVFAYVHTSAGGSPLTQLLEATVVLNMVTLVLKELDDGVFGQVKLCWQGVDGLLIWVQANILDEALQDTQGLQGNLECTQQGFRKDTSIKYNNC